MVVGVWMFRGVIESVDDGFAAQPRKHFGWADQFLVKQPPVDKRIVLTAASQWTSRYKHVNML